MSEEIKYNLKRIFLSLLKADAKIQWRNRRSSIMSILTPIIILLSWSGIVETIGAAYALSSVITIGLITVGLMSYANITASDRERGVFQRLRVTPAPTWTVMSSRIIMQLILMLAMTIVLYLFGYFLYGITLTPSGYILGAIIALACGTVFLGLGQLFVGLIKSASTVRSSTRLFYILFILVGAFAGTGFLGTLVKDVISWSPYGTVNEVLLAGMQPATWSGITFLQLGVTIVYGVIFIFFGIKWFKWEGE